MEANSNIRSLYEVKLGASLSEADLAIVSTDSRGLLGQLNSTVLKSLGYGDSALENEDVNLYCPFIQRFSYNIN